MTNIFFEDERITKNDLYFVCYMIERIARKLKQPNKYVANIMGHDELCKSFLWRTCCTAHRHRLSWKTGLELTP